MEKNHWSDIVICVITVIPREITIRWITV